MAMISDECYGDMVRLRIRTFADKAREISEDPALDELTFPEKVELCVQAERIARSDRRTAKRNREARFAHPSACIEDIAYLPDRSIRKESIERLASCAYIEEKRNVIVLSATGAGKSYVSQALGNAACRRGHSVRYIRQADLAREFDIARRNDAVYECFDAFASTDLLILDDLFLTDTPMGAVSDLLQIVEKRIGKGSLIIASQLAPEEWHLRIDTKIVADALLDRIVHNSHLIEIVGPNMRAHCTMKSQGSTA
jgi:DNA replication protein DnaC